jgi:hypothetical protein
MVTGFFDFPKSAFTTPCCTSRSCIFTYQISKLFFPLNFSISNLTLWVFVISRRKNSKITAYKTKPFIWKIILY